MFLLHCTTFKTDYEVAMRNALRKVFEDSKLVACYFHYCQVVKKRAASTHGFVDMFRTNTDAHSVYYRLNCLPLLPPEYNKAMYTELKTGHISAIPEVFS